MDSYTFANFFNSASLNGHAGLTFSEEVMQRMLDYQAGTDTNGVLASSNGQWGKPEHDPLLQHMQILIGIMNYTRKVCFLKNIISV